MAKPLIEDFIIDDRAFLFIVESSHSKNFRMNFHRHDFYELSFVLGGKGQYEILGADGEIRNVPVEANQILLWDGSVPHRARDGAKSPLQQLILIFDESYLADYDVRTELRRQLRGTNPLVIRNPLFTMPLKNLIRDVLMEKRGQKVLRDAVIYADLLSILTTLLRSSTGLEPVLGESTDARIRKALSHIHEQYFHSLAVPDIASYCALSVRQFSALFKKHTGQSFIQYLHTYRIEKAKAALRETDKSITDIAFEAGYDDPAHFVQRFRKLENTTPTQYRKIHAYKAPSTG